MNDEKVTASYLTSWLINNISGLNCDDSQSNIIITTCEGNGYSIIKKYDNIYLTNYGKNNHFENEIYPEELLVFANESISEQIEISKDLLHNFNVYDLSSYSSEFMNYLRLNKNYKILNDMLKTTNYYQEFLNCLNFVLNRKLGKKKKKIQNIVNIGEL